MTKFHGAKVHIFLNLARFFFTESPHFFQYVEIIPYICSSYFGIDIVG